MLHAVDFRPARGTISPVPAQPQLKVELANDPSLIEQAQRLRWRVFVGEMGARLRTPLAGVDRDLFDPYCEHLVVRDIVHDQVVGTYRILAPQAAAKLGAFYSDSEFDMVRLKHLRSRLVEVGRSCIHPDYRGNPAVISLLWSGLAAYMRERRHDYLIGCASLGLADGGYSAAAVYAGLAHHLAPLEYRVYPRHRLPLERLGTQAPASPPPLVKGYLRAGAWVCGEPAWDRDFQTADLFMLLPMARLAPRYARHFLERAQ
ncbi:MAG: GNAT family N-acetyltransferase [Rhodocyclaceae bacterium]|nr:GNAT family N-acetyltransferase [Rhodocyclaceae bacterium]